MHRFYFIFILFFINSYLTRAIDAMQAFEQIAASSEQQQ